MGIGTKRICQACAAKFYDLEKDPIKCPKCATVFNPESIAKPKRGRKKAGAKEQPEEEIEIVLDDEVIEELDDEAAVEELDDEIRDEMEPEDSPERHKGEDKVLVDLEEDNSDIIESDDGHISDKE